MTKGAKLFLSKSCSYACCRYHVWTGLFIRLHVNIGPFPLPYRPILTLQVGDGHSLAHSQTDWKSQHFYRNLYPLVDTRWAWWVSIFVPMSHAGNPGKFNFFFTHNYWIFWFNLLHFQPLLGYRLNQYCGNTSALQISCRGSQEINTI